jgi:hypothetical protein
MIWVVGTTLDIDEDVLETAKELAARRGTTAGRVLSDLARSALASRRACILGLPFPSCQRL